MLKLSLLAALSLSLPVSFAFGASLSGSVVDSMSGKPISGAMVTVGSKVTRTGSTGGFQIEGNESAIQARAYGYTRAQVAAERHDAKSIQLKLAPFTPHAVYLSFWGVGTSSVRDPALRLATTTPVNAVVLDVKGDLGYICYRTAVPLAGEIGAQKIITVPDMQQLLQQLHKRGIYTIARIVTFKDNMLCNVRPKLAAHQNGKIFKDHEGLTWCDPFLPEVQRYNIDLAVDSAKAGFDEIQFDYVRFPDAKGVEFSQPSTDDSRSKTITAFLSEAREKLIPYNVFLAADVFGYICWNKGDTASDRGSTTSWGRLTISRRCSIHLASCTGSQIIGIPSSILMRLSASRSIKSASSFSQLKPMIPDWDATITNGRRSLASVDADH